MGAGRIRLTQLQKYDFFQYLQEKNQPHLFPQHTNAKETIGCTYKKNQLF